MSTIRNIIVGTAGHIDHGKSSIVQQLTGVHPDRLAEERARGMTIDLGFAPYTHASGATVGLIDVPGHERFIKNMVAGSTSVDVAMLVVAADDGVMPQTREHLEILRLLGVNRGLVVLNKIDLVEDELRELALEDVADFVAGTFLAEAPRVAVSAVTGEGIDQLRAQLDQLISEVPPHTDDGPFRLPVQRVFSAKGHGLVVTGVPVSGRVAAGDVLELVDSGQTVRVRGIQAYGAAREKGHAGHSTALNLAGATHEDVRRGDVVGTPGVFVAARFLAADYEHVDADTALRQHHPVRVHVGTAEVLGRAALLDSEAGLVRGQHATVQLRLQQAVTAAPGDRLLVRDAASMVVLGGGVLVSSGAGRLKRFKERVLEDLHQRRAVLGQPVQLACVALRAAGRRGRRLGDLALDVGRPASELAQLLEPELEQGHVLRAGQDLYLAVEAVAEMADELVEALKAEHKLRPLMDWVDLNAVRARLDFEESALRMVLEQDRRFETEAGGRVRRRGHRGSVGPEQRAARERILATLSEAGATPPQIDEAFTGLPTKQTRALLEMMRHAGEIVAVQGHLFHRDALALLRTRLVEHGRQHGGEIHIPALRDALGTSRKYLIPLLEHFDASGLTVRHGDRRVLRQRDESSS